MTPSSLQMPIIGLHNIHARSSHSSPQPHTFMYVTDGDRLQENVSLIQSDGEIQLACVG
jgi:RecB family exonuclease